MYKLHCKNPLELPSVKYKTLENYRLYDIRQYTAPGIKLVIQSLNYIHAQYSGKVWCGKRLMNG